MFIKCCSEGGTKGVHLILGAPFTKHPFPASINNHIRYEVWYWITFPFPNFNGAAAEVLEWIGNLFQHFIGRVLELDPCFLGSCKIILVLPAIKGLLSRETTQCGDRFIRVSLYHGPLTRYVKLRVAHALGMPGKFPPPTDFKGNR